MPDTRLTLPRPNIDDAVELRLMGFQLKQHEARGQIVGLSRHMNLPEGWTWTQVDGPGDEVRVFDAQGRERLAARREPCVIDGREEPRALWLRRRYSVQWIRGDDNTITGHVEDAATEPPTVIFTGRTTLVDAVDLIRIEERVLTAWLFRLYPNAACPSAYWDD